MHSVGIGAVNGTGNIRTVKAAALPHVFLGDKTVQDVFIGVNRVLIGHNRFATQGAINNENAHPYMFDNIMGAHNGSLKNTSLLPHHKDFPVDSQVLLNSIDKYGVEATEEKIHGAFALTWYDKRDKTLHMWRNNERPLWWCYTEDEKAIFWASEKEMLSLIFARNNIKHKEFIEVQEDTHLTFTIDMAANQKVQAPLVKQRKKYVPPYVAPTNYGNWQGSGRYGRSNWGYDDDYADWSNKSLVGVSTEKKPNPLRLVGGSNLGNQVELASSPLSSSDRELLLKLRSRVEVVRELYSAIQKTTLLNG